MRDKKETVLEQLIRDCRKAHQARVPLIMVDTEEIELMDRLAKESKMVDFFTTGKKGKSVDSRHKPYYTYLGEDPQPLDASVNFTYSVRELSELIAFTDTAEYVGSSIEGGVTAPGKAPLPVMAVLHISHTSWKRTSSSSADDTLINFLRSYVQAYTRCRDLNSVLRSCRVLLYGDPTLLPSDLVPYTEIVTVSYPQIWELEQIIRRVAAENNKPVSSESKAPLQLAEKMTGFGLIHAERFVQKLYWIDHNPDESPLSIDEYYPLLMEEKAKAVRSAGGLLELYFEKKPPKENQEEPNPSANNTRMGGMAAYKDWVTGRKQQMHSYADYASRRGVPALKGVLLCGVPGCGKSMAAKMLHREWGISMLRMDIDRLMGGLVGDSERNMRQALALAEAMSPVILWIDEIEKGFAGASSSSNDGATFKRMFGRLLTWMQENTKPCFIFATANDISQLPPEFFRSGRFDALFSVYMPTHEECKQIFAAQMQDADELRKEKLREKGGDPSTLHALFDQSCYGNDCLEGIMTLVTGGKKRGDKTDAEAVPKIRFVSGADIRKIVTTALAQIPEKAVRKPISSSDWLAVLKQVIEDPSLTTQGSSSSNLDEIAACYVRLMRKNFAPVSDKRQLLFEQQYYSCSVKDNKLEAVYTGEAKESWPAYDRALFFALKPRILNIASLVETNAFKRISY